MMEQLADDQPTTLLFSASLAVDGISRQIKLVLNYSCALLGGSKVTSKQASTSKITTSNLGFQWLSFEFCCAKLWSIAVYSGITSDNAQKSIVSHIPLNQRSFSRKHPKMSFCLAPGCVCTVVGDVLNADCTCGHPKHLHKNREFLDRERELEREQRELEREREREQRGEREREREQRGERERDRERLWTLLGR
jgi:hypothetical protein